MRVDRGTCDQQYRWATHHNGDVIVCCLPWGHDGEHEDRNPVTDGTTVWENIAATTKAVA